MLKTMDKNNHAGFISKPQRLKAFMDPLIKYFYQDQREKIEKIVESGFEKKVVLIICNDMEWLMGVTSHLQDNDTCLVTVSNLNHAFAAYYTLEPDLVIVGKMQHVYLSAFQYIDEVKKRYTPLVMIYNMLTKKDRKQFIQLGIHEFIPLTTEADEFVVRIQQHIRRKKTLDSLIYLDELTNVYNRKYVDTVFTQLLEKRTFYKEQLSLALVDIDDFKQINDMYGHLMGDNVLKKLAYVLKTGTRRNDVIIRFGGEEFLLLFPKTTQEEAEEKMKTMLNRFSQIRFFENKHTFTCTFSSGVYELPYEEIDLQTSLRKVDHALLQAKNNGKNQVSVL